MVSKINFGIIGCSSVAKNSFIPAILKTNHAVLESVGSRSISKSKFIARKFHCKNFGNYDDVLENKKIDVVYISLPIALQEKWIMKAAKAGKHILCEKSSTTSYHSAQKIVKECKKNGVRIMENFSFIFHPQQTKILQLVNSNKFGKTFSFSGKFGFNLNYSANNFRFKKELGGGILNDVGCYIIRASQFIFQSMPLTIFCNLDYNKKYKIDMKGTIFMTFPNGNSSIGEFGYCNGFQSRYSIWSEKSIITTDRAFNIKRNQSSKISITSEKNSKTFQVKKYDQFKLLLDFFCKVIQKNSSDKSLFEDSLLRQALIMDYARKSSKLKSSLEIKL